MSRHRHTVLSIVLATVLTLTLSVGPAVAEGEFSVLGLSASPDSYVDEIEVDFDQEFQLYVIIAGPGAVEPLTKDFSSVNWAVLQACCGGSPAFMIESVLHSESLVHEGEPIVGVHTSAPVCIDADIITLATLTFTWLYEPAGSFLLGAAAMSAAEFCGEETEFLSGCSVRIVPLGITPAEDKTWGEVKSLYR